jgi:hypothetical protein
MRLLSPHVRKDFIYLSSFFKLYFIFYDISRKIPIKMLEIRKIPRHFF